MALRKFKGDLVFNEDALTLDLHVIPRDKDQVNVASGTNSLSGGERSYVTVSLLMSLWKCVDHPFFFLDEYDVFTVSNPTSENQLNDFRGVILMKTFTSVCRITSIESILRIFYWEKRLNILNSSTRFWRHKILPTFGLQSVYPYNGTSPTEFQIQFNKQWTLITWTNPHLF